MEEQATQSIQGMPRPVPEQKPSVGRIVHFFDRAMEGNERVPKAAIITKVYSELCVNLVVFPDHGGLPMTYTSVCKLHPATQAAQAVMWGWDWPARV